MLQNERLIKFLELQKSGDQFDEISKELGIASATLRSFLNKQGYKSIKGIYKLVQNDVDNHSREVQLNLDDITEKKNILKKNSKVKNDSGINLPLNKKVEKRTKAKKNSKINITEEDLDKLCEVYDWYLEVKDYKSMRPKNTISKKDIVLDNIKSTEIKSTNIKIDKKTWEDFDRLCSNSKYSKQEIITQALKDFMKQYKNLI